MDNDNTYRQRGALALADGRARLADPNSIPIKSQLLRSALTVLQKGTSELVAAVEEGRISLTRAAKLAAFDSELQIREANAAYFENKRFRSRLDADAAVDAAEIDSHLDPDWKRSRGYAIQAARCAITQLEPVPRGNKSREEAFDIVVEWINSNRRARK